MDVILISALCITACIVIRILKKDAAEFSFAITVGVTVMAAAVIISDITDITDTLDSLLKKINLDSEYSEILFKSIGICFLGSIAADLCSDSGESALSGSVRMLCRITVLILALPLYSSVISLIDEMLG